MKKVSELNKDELKKDLSKQSREKYLYGSAHFRNEVISEMNINILTHKNTRTTLHSAHTCFINHLDL